MSRFGAFSLIFGLIVVALVVYSLQGVDEVTCEVCVTFKGKTECRVGQGRTKEDAIQQAQTSACAVMTNGMDEVVACGRIQPTSVSCD
jgi:hypothetical protein